ncbi:MAG: indolepyruvate ferredoxin oxidoreductase subunit alpha [Caldisericia bacterium]|nr:indolepyruvate ferredoxin oxidoreductase subunit alpha [Caldisericia bacterium]
MLLDNKPGLVELLMGNQAVVRGALEAGVSVACTYPGTPASEIGDTFAKNAEASNSYYWEYSTNEKVAFETALAGSWSNLRSIVAMKHVGINVAADALMSMTYGGNVAGLILAVGDDPSCFSSQNEQDSRNYCRFGMFPCMEPSSPQETKDMVKYAFDLSEKFRLPVLLRQTTRSAHCSGNVEYGSIPETRNEVKFTKDKLHKAVLPSHAYKLHPDLIARFSDLKKDICDSPWTRLTLSGKFGIIANGLTGNYVKEALHYEGIENISFLHLGITYPLPEDTLRKMINHCDKILVVEELDPITEETLIRLAFEMGKNIEIHGKDVLPETYEFNTRIVHKAILEVLSKKETVSCQGEDLPDQSVMPPRFPVLCPGCPHRATFYAIRKAVPKGIYPSDIGCYTLGIQPPLNAVDTCVCMGGSIGTGAALAHFNKEDIFATIGDSTFFHTGMPALVNAVWNKSKVNIVLVDNSITAMTGQQPNPSCGLTSTFGVHDEPILPEKVAEAVGVKFIRVVNPLNLKETTEVFKEAAAFKDGPTFIVSRSPCCMMKGFQKKPIVHINTETCISCKICTSKFSCPALIWDEEKKHPIVDETMCNGCGACIEVCPVGAITSKKEQ